MTDPTPEKPKRRPRYGGTNPRGFHEKYKEHQPHKYPDDVAKVLAAGKTPAGMHRPIMVSEILDVLHPEPGDTAVDCTLGFGGHARELLTRVQPSGRLIALDADPIELPKSEARLRTLGYPEASLVVKHTNFAAITRVMAELAPEGANVLLADLGLSSMQIDNPARGFSFKVQGPLDMRMNPEKGVPASALLSKLGVKSLAEILVDNADEPHAAHLSAAILRAHSQEPITTTNMLVKVVRQSALQYTRRDETDDTVRRVFQALRIAVNHEFEALDAFLRSLPGCLKPGARLAILSFHSGEDRRVKNALKEGLYTGVYSSVCDELMRPTAEERWDNPRSSSAKLRYAVRA